MGEQNDPNVQIIENATEGDVRAGDHVTWKWVRERDGGTIAEIREGIAHHRNTSDDWCTKDGMRITDGEGEGEDDGITITIRRPVQELPTKAQTVIVPSDGCGAIEATVFGFVWRASEAVLGTDGRWHGVWRKDGGSGVLGYVAPSFITSPTWKVDDQ